MHYRSAMGWLSSGKAALTQTGRKSALVAAFFALAISSPAAPLFGEFNISGEVTVDLLSIDWHLPATEGNFVTNAPATGAFTGINTPFPQFGTAQDLFAPPVPVANFLSGFTAAGFEDLFFDLSSIVAPVAAPCDGSNPAIGVECALGAFTVRNTTNGVSVDFGVLGFFQMGADLTSRTPGIGLYTTQLVGSTVAGVYNTVINQGGSISASYSANYEAIPEPATMVLLGAGLVAIGFLRRRNS